MAAHSPLALHLPDADRLTAEELTAVLTLQPAAMLVLCYAQWDNDKGVADQTSELVRLLGHDRLYVRFHADPHPPGYAKKIGGPEAWGRLCAQRMTQYYLPLQTAGVQLHAILANEVDADYEGGLSVAQASDFYRRALGEYAAKRPQDMIHVPAPTGAPSTHREHLQRFKADGWLSSDYWIDGHGYNGDLENVLHVLSEECPVHQYVITETNNLDDFGWPIDLLNVGMARDIVYFTLNWARGGEGRVQPPTADDAAKQMSLMRFPDRYAQFKATIVQSEPAPTPEPVPIPVPEPTTMISGIDVSNNNGTIDWGAVISAGVTWAYAKVSEGSGYRDRFFPANWAAMRDRGLVRGGYHFARPSENDPETEADWFLSLVDAAGGLDVGDFLVLDHEDERASGDTGWWALQWLRYVEQRVGFKPMIYTGKWIIDGQNLAAYPALAEYGLILAAYQGSAPPAPAPWPFLAGWQNADQTGVPGVTGDHDWFFGTVEQLRLYGKPGTVEPPAPADELTRLHDQVNGLVSALSYTADDLGDRVAALATKNKAATKERDAIVAEMARVRAESVGPRP